MKVIELKVRRIKAGLRQYEVAAKVGISATKLCEIEAGRRKPSDELLERVFQAIKDNHYGQTERKS